MLPLMPVGRLPLEQSAGRIVAEVERPGVYEPALLVVAVEPDVVGPHVDPDPVVVEFTGSVASPLDHLWMPYAVCLWMMAGAAVVG
jgi:hypothetical protein